MGIGAGVLVLVLLLIFGGIALFGNRDSETATGGGGGSTPAAPKKPGDAVRSYLEALNSGNAASVLALSDDQPQDKTFLTDAVLRSATQKTPISDIQVTDPSSDDPYSIDVLYKIGDQTVSDSIPVEKIGSEWKVKQAWAEASIYQGSDLPLYLNGVQAKAEKVYLFPGVYTATTGNSYISYGSESSVLVKSPEAYPSFSGLEATLTSAGKSAFVSTVKSAVNACVKSSSLKPGCGLNGFRASSGVKVTGVKHSIASGSLDRMDVNISASDPFTAKAYPSVAIKTTAKCNGGSCTGLYNQYLGSVSVDLSRKPLRATWS